MPRTSKRRRLLHKLRRVVDARRQEAALRFFFDADDGFADDVDDQVELRYEEVSLSRYAFRSSQYRKRPGKWKIYLGDDSVLNDEEFLAHFRVSRSAFSSLLTLIEGDPVFKPTGRRTFRGGPELHLLVLLKFLGTFGNDNSSLKLGVFFGIGKGTIKKYVGRTTRAVLKLRDRTITWPDNNERMEIARRIQNKFDFVNCVGLIDGTLLPLALKPSKNGEDYFSRKGGYSLNAMIVCDDVSRVRDAVVGWTGSVHDNRVWTNSRVCRASDVFFDHNQYLLGDSAFQPSPCMVPAFTKPPKSDMIAIKSSSTPSLPRLVSRQNIASAY